MNEEVVKLGNEQLQKGLTYGQVAYLFAEQTSGAVKDAMQAVEDVYAVDQSKLSKMQEELHYFFFFALVYWWQKSPHYTQEQKRNLEKVLFPHLETGLGDDIEGGSAWDALRERIIAYGQTASELEQKDYSAMLHVFAGKLSEYCGVGYLHFAILVPSLFKTALDTVSVLKADKKRSK